MLKKKLAPVCFVKANEADETSNKPSGSKNIPLPIHKGGGEEVRNFYENVLKDGTDCTNMSEDIAPNKSKYNRGETSCSSKNKSSHHVVKNKRKSPRKRDNINKHDSQLLRFAQEGSTRKVEEFLKQGVAVDLTDDYGWSALMCAACAGHLSTVQFLLDNGANPDLRNKQGKKAVDLTSNKRIKKLLDADINQDINNDDDQEVVEQNTFYCDVCKMNVESVSQKVHSTSTLHLFNSNLPQPGTSYFIPESNKGFQLMVQTGWDKEVGLGSQGQGQKFPVKTVLKRDRSGFGIKSSDKAKVTHFGPKDIKAVTAPKKSREMKLKTITKRQMAKKQSKLKSEEAAFRREFYVD